MVTMSPQIDGLLLGLANIYIIDIVFLGCCLYPFQSSSLLFFIKCVEYTICHKFYHYKTKFPLANVCYLLTRRLMFSLGFADMADLNDHCFYLVFIHISLFSLKIYHF